jgi:thiosulfate/3-mercaptopyruvate sulfurtransferase
MCMTRYVIIGAGAIGGCVAAQLHLADIPVVMVARGAHAEQLRAGGLRYLRPDGDHLLDIPVVGGPREIRLRRGDVLVLATKSQHTEQVLQEWSWQSTDTGQSAAESLPILILQNALDNERSALRRFRSVLGAAVWLPADHLVPGEVIAQGLPKAGILWLGRYPSGSGPDARSCAEDLRRAGFAVQVVEDLPRWKAAKLLNNTANAIDALYQPGPRADALAARVRAEAREVFAAAGVSVADWATESDEDLTQAKAAPVAGRSRVGGSTMQSLHRGTGSIEVDFLNGEITLLGRLHGVPTPLNEALQAQAARVVEQGGPPRSADIAVLEALLDGEREEQPT